VLTVCTGNICRSPTAERLLALGLGPTVKVASAGTHALRGQPVVAPMCAMIEDAGFEVLEAANADEAILILENRSDIRIVFTDVHMPGSMDGLRLAHAVRDRWPPIKLIVTSGQMTVSEDELPLGGRFFSKPYQPSELSRVLNELVA